MRQRGIGGNIARAELIKEMAKKYNPAVSSYKVNSAIRSSADRCLCRLRFHGFLKICDRGSNEIIKLLPNIEFSDFVTKYPRKKYASRQ